MFRRKWPRRKYKTLTKERYTESSSRNYKSLMKGKLNAINAPADTVNFNLHHVFVFLLQVLTKCLSNLQQHSQMVKQPCPPSCVRQPAMGWFKFCLPLFMQSSIAMAIAPPKEPSVLHWIWKPKGWSVFVQMELFYHTSTHTVPMVSMA